MKKKWRRENEREEKTEKDNRKVKQRNKEENYMFHSMICSLPSYASVITQEENLLPQPSEIYICYYARKK